MWFSNRRARLRKHAGSITHSPISSLPLTTCQYAAASHQDLAQIPQVSQMPGGIAQVPTTLHQAPGGMHQVSGTVVQMAQVPTTMSSALQGSAVTIPGHLGSLPAHTATMQLAQVSTMQPPAAHGAPTSLSHNSGECRLHSSPIGRSIECNLEYRSLVPLFKTRLNDGVLHSNLISRYLTPVFSGTHLICNDRSAEYKLELLSCTF